MTFHKKVLLIFVVLALLSSCHPYESHMVERAKKAKKATGDIEIGVMWASSVYRDLFLDGINLSVEEINNRGGVNGRKIKLIVYDDRTDFSRAMNYARDFARRTDIVAVIGHHSSLNAISASVIYQYNGLLFISPRATSPVLTGHNFNLVFRIMPSDSEIGNQLARVAYKTGFRKMAIVDDESAYGKELADLFFEVANDIGIEIASRRYYFPWQETVKPLLADIRKQSIDAIFLAGEQPSVSMFIKESRLMGIKAPFIGGDSLDSPLLLNIAGSAAEGTIVPTVYDPFSSDPVARRFIDKFHFKYGIDPDTSAALGYDAMNLLAYAFNESQSTVPIVVSSYLRFVQDWHGVTSPYTFNINGDLVDKKLFFKVIHNGRFQFLPEDFISQKGG